MMSICIRTTLQRTSVLYRSLPLHKSYVSLKQRCHPSAPVVHQNKVCDEFDDYYYKYPLDLIHEQSDTVRTIDKIILEMELCLRFKYQKMPKSVSSDDWGELLTFENFGDRRRLYSYIYTREKTIELKKKKIKERELFLSLEKSIFKEFNNPTRTLPGQNMIQISGVDVMCKKFSQLAVSKSQIFGPHMILDCSYDTHMTEKELSICALQVNSVNTVNRKRTEPFDIIHCNINTNGPLIKHLSQLQPKLFSRNFVFHYTDQSFIDLFPGEKLIYLSPHADTELDTFDNNVTYIIGTFVDLCAKDFISTGKAKYYGVKTAKFPLDKYLYWCKGTKSLTLDQAVRILMDLKDGCSWEEVLQRNIQRKNTTFTLLDEELTIHNSNQLLPKYLKTMMLNEID